MSNSTGRRNGRVYKKTGSNGMLRVSWPNCGSIWRASRTVIDHGLPTCNAEITDKRGGTHPCGTRMVEQ